MRSLSVHSNTSQSIRQFSWLLHNYYCTSTRTHKCHNAIEPIALTTAIFSLCFSLSYFRTNALHTTIASINHCSSKSSIIQSSTHPCTDRLIEIKTLDQTQQQPAEALTPTASATAIAAASAPGKKQLNATTSEQQLSKSLNEQEHLQQTAAATAATTAAATTATTTTSDVQRHF